MDIDIGQTIRDTSLLSSAHERALSDVFEWQQMASCAYCIQCSAHKCNCDQLVTNYSLAVYICHLHDNIKEVATPWGV